MKKTKQLIQRYNAEHSYVVIRDYKLKEDIILKDHNQKGKMTFTFQMKRQMALKGELLLAELDDMYGVTTSLERLLEILWIDYIKSSKQMSEKKMISEFLKLLKENE